MHSFDYHEPTTIGAAVGLLGELGDDATLIAGGTALALLLKEGLIRPDHLIGLRRIAELSGIAALDDGGLEIRALTSHRQAETSALVSAYCPALAETFGTVATIRIRNQGTIGGNLAHADPAQDPPPMLLALAADVVLAGPAGERTVPLDGFFVDYYETTLAADEVLVAVRLPPLPAAARTAYVKFLPRSQSDYATASVAVFLELDADGRCRDLRIGIGAASSTPIRAKVVEDALRGERLAPGLVRAAAALIEPEIDPLDDARGSSAYKRSMTREWIERTILDLARRPGPATAAGDRPFRTAAGIR
jgi:carbon-monoxide dehydrogenase medium subunit